MKRHVARLVLWVGSALCCGCDQGEEYREKCFRTTDDVASELNVPREIVQEIVDRSDMKPRAYREHVATNAIRYHTGHHLLASRWELDALWSESQIKQMREILCSHEGRIICLEKSVENFARELGGKR